ncbi:MAG: magnesium transporter [Candidatus Melainabacteria bacterium]|nr:magnesium transporter [Candidatus Melainabacteria bacterium]
MQHLIAFPGSPAALSLMNFGESFGALTVKDQAEMIRTLPVDRKRMAIRVLDPDDAADLLQHLQANEREELLALLDTSARAEVRALLAYSEDVAGGLMNPRFVRVRPPMTVTEAISYVRKQLASDVATASYLYVLDFSQKLLGVLSMKELMMAPAGKKIQELMRKDFVSVAEGLDREEVANVFASSGLIAVPVLDASGSMKGVVTADDIVYVVREEATKDIQQLGGTAALDTPYLSARLSTMIRKRAGWLVMLFMGELLTASAMAHFENAIAKAVVLALFVPLIISSGGNSGSQASTLVIRAMALGEVKLSDWFRVMRRELLTGLVLGLVLGLLGLTRVLLWQNIFGVYGEHYVFVGLTVGLSLIGVVMWGSLIGSLLPFALRKLGFDPATACAPFVATIVDVTGLVIYFSVASTLLVGRLV